MQANKLQMRGHCQVCGRQQAVVRGTMSKHGYQIKQGWFVGVCHGQDFEPVEVSRTELDRVCAMITADCNEIKTRKENLLNGTIKPKTLPFWNGRTGKYDDRDTDTLEPYEFAHGLRTLINQMDTRIRCGEHHVETMTAIANEYHGKPLVEVDTHANKPEVIVSGEKRLDTDGRVFTCQYTERGRVYWVGVDYRGEPCKSWMGSASWRAMQKVA